jgi:cell division protein FtsZ
MTPGAPQPAPSAREAPGRAPRPIWHAPGDVLIEERGPAGGGAEAARGPSFDARRPREESFAPAPPSEIARASRRIPEIDDFPAVGQREYHAKSGHVGQEGRDPGAGRRAAPEAPRRLGFLQRLTGRGARPGDSSEVNSSDPGRPHASQAGGQPPSRPAAHQPDASQASPRGWTEQDQHTDLPGFFGKGRK